MELYENTKLYKFMRTFPRKLKLAKHPQAKLNIASFRKTKTYPKNMYFCNFNDKMYVAQIASSYKTSCPGNPYSLYLSL